MKSADCDGCDGATTSDRDRCRFDPLGGFVTFEPAPGKLTSSVRRMVRTSSGRRFHTGGGPARMLFQTLIIQVIGSAAPSCRNTLERAHDKVAKGVSSPNEVRGVRTVGAPRECPSPGRRNSHL